MSNKRILDTLLCLVLLLGFISFKSNTVFAESTWVQTPQDGTGLPADGYNKYGSPISAYDTVQAWHYEGKGGGYWKITDMNTAHTYPTIPDSRTDFLLSHYDTPQYMSTFVRIPDDVLADIAMYGEDSVRASIHAKNPEIISDTSDLWYHVSGPWLEIQFKGHLQSTGQSFWDGKSGFVPMPLVDPNYGENGFSVFDVNTGVHIGGMYTLDNTRQITADDIVMSPQGWGTFKDGNAVYKVYDENYGIRYIKGSDMKISLGALARGGAQAAIYDFGFDVQFFTKGAPPLPDAGDGDIIFKPASTYWTNKGKTGEGQGTYPIAVTTVNPTPAETWHRKFLETDVSYTRDDKGNITGSSSSSHIVKIPYNVHNKMEDLVITGTTDSPYSGNSVSTKLPYIGGTVNDKEGVSRYKATASYVIDYKKTDNSYYKRSVISINNNLFRTSFSFNQSAVYIDLNSSFLL